MYCNEDTGGMVGAGMMGGGMMNMMMGGNMDYGMMNAGYGFGYWNFLSILYTLLVIGLVILVYLGIVKLWRDLFHGKRK